LPANRRASRVLRADNAALSPKGRLGLPRL